MSPVGQPVDRVDGPLKVTGTADYVADHKIDRLAYGYVVTSTIALGTITSMQTEAALAAPGVLAVYSPFNSLKLFAYTQAQNDETRPPLQDMEVRYYGQLIALVVAETFEQARDAASLIKTTYTERTPATSFQTGLPNATPPPSGTPVVDVLAPGVPSIDAALAASEVTVSATYTTPVNNHIAMEPHATLASWTGDHLTIYTVSQGVRLVVTRMANTLGIDAAKVHVHNPYVGGGFGNKWGNWAHTPVTAAAARALGRPIKTVLTREQTFTIVGHRPQSTQTVALGAYKDGRLVAIKNDGVSSMSPASNFYEPVANLSLSLYASPNLHVSRRVVRLDVPPTTIMRAPQEANGSFALESAMDELAEKLGMDPLELRRKNDSPVVPSNGRPWSSKHLDECYRIGAEKFGWSRRNPAPRSVIDGDWLVGMGIGTATYSAGRGDASIKVRFQSDGTVKVSGTAADLGTGQSTVFAILAADKLGIPVSRVIPELGDSSSPTAANAGGSSSTSTNGPAVQLAADAARTALVKFAAETPGSPFQGKEVRYADGSLIAGDLSITFGALLTQLDVPAVEATAASPRVNDPVRGFRSFGATFCEVRVNRWTAEPRVSRMLCVVDAGTIVNLKSAHSQIAGGLIMGIGHALLEATHLDANGRFANATMQSYMVPVNSDVPPIDVHFLNYPDTYLSPLGARGIGEFSIVGAAGAVANAVHNATGKRIRDLPITLDKLL
ncbi:xanthine dehydrogenase YagR molybdenum-binding subunit [Kibdelosporangium banguiense]|uniref:Xanthine dehydrogenase YagR molybdenum-binding subunit n=1 Tax=Kibdelosporangium banguiense TaxID=1365924 RepID=A0ABS4TMT5_9PSEU|nr:xanthine dehydrogenase family protein molybdopterin-binding subunit [Kibdelosporangium banguiense]MBP2325280.1 xanthine dehydrogenase YagR molybdenum-binding subunit [Kibdelosporangium banguiense]